MFLLYKMSAVVVLAAAASAGAACAGRGSATVPERQAAVAAPAGTNENSSSAEVDFAVTVSKEGFQPSEIKVEKGKPVRIAFKRIDEQNCASEVVFDSQNIRKKLPVGQTVIVEFTPKAAGDISFSCGMGMMKGKVLVQ